MYLLHRAGGWPGQQSLSEDLARGISPHPPNKRAAELMERYRDRPMDFADATLVALAEERKLARVAEVPSTLDSDFHIYRIDGKRRFDVVPE